MSAAVKTFDPVSSKPDRQIIYRDPGDIRAILATTRATLLVTLVLLISLAFNIYQYWRRPDRIVVDMTSGRTLMINDREYGATETAQLGPEKLTNTDKEYLGKEFVQALYQIDPATRPRDIEKALRLMVPVSAIKFTEYLKQDGILEKQRAESWQAVWTPQDVTVDKLDPYIVHLIGQQQITKVVAGSPQTETHQLNLTLKLMADPQGRADRNLRSGFLVAAFDYKELNRVTGVQ